jgi:hypothetical protein
MGCGASSLRGDDYPSIAADAKTSRMRTLSNIESLGETHSGVTQRPSVISAISSHTSKPHVQAEHYETAAEHDRDLKRLASSQRRASRPAYVDPNELPMPPKTTHQHYHRHSSASDGDTLTLGQKAQKSENSKTNWVGW